MVGSERSEWWAVSVLALAVCASCGDDDGMSPDSGVDMDSSVECESNSDCDDGQFCNGSELCESGECVAGDLPCRANETCDDDADECVADECAEDGDADGDGELSIACGGSDCDDEDPTRYPGATEVCDAEHRDEDCNPTTFGFRDADNDFSPDAQCCNTDPSTGTMNCGDDCNDLRPNVNISASEVCDGFDNDCDEEIDEGVVQQFFIDTDLDTYGNESGAMVEACFAPDGYAAMGRDCDDSNPDINPGRPELCDDSNVDENCDGMANPDSLCMCDGDISELCPLPGVCSAGTRRCVNGNWGACSIAPTGELCNMLDDDCDGAVDERLAVTCYVDDDDDGFPSGDPTPFMHCPQPGRGAVGGCPVLFTDVQPFGADIDCNDAEASVNPAATEICDAAMVDENCDDIANPNPPCECSGNGTENCPMPGICGSGERTCVDGSWTACTVQPSPEVCDGVDNDCNGMVDDGSLCTGADSYQVCSLGECAVTGCVDGYGDCDGQVANGCEANVDTDPMACGRCGVRCTAGAECNSGVCTQPVGIAAAYRSTCILWSGGTVSCFGDNGNAQLGDGTQNDSPNPVVVLGLTDAVSLTAGAGHFCAIRTDQTVVCWGSNSFGQSGHPSLPRVSTPMAVPGLSGALELIASYDHTCARTALGVYCWGDNEYGQLGDGTNVDSSTPVEVTGLTNAISLGNGPSHVCAVRDDNTVVCWGRNQNGQLGDGTMTDQPSPVVTMWTDVTNIGGGGQLDAFTCARHMDGTVSCAGAPGSQMGSSAMAGGSTPEPIVGATTVQSAYDCGGSEFNCFIMNDDTVQCIGRNRDGALGHGMTGGSSDMLVAVTGPTNVQQLTTGLDHACVFTDAAEIWCWGDNSEGQLGDGSMVDRTSATLLPGIRQMATVGTFENMACGSRNDGIAFCWGGDTQGARGDGPGTTSTPPPTEVLNIDDASSVAVGRFFACVRHADTTVSCWGLNNHSQLGISMTGNQDTPVQIPGLSNVREVVAGYEHACALMMDGTVKCWGRSSRGLGDGMNTESDTPVDVVGVTTAVQVSTGSNRTCGRFRDGTVSCWGNSLTPVAGITDAVDLGVFLNHSCVVRPNGTVWCWGQNSEGQLGDGTTTASANTPVEVSGLSRAVAIQGGNYFSCALLEGGQIQCWGINSEGQLGDGTNMVRHEPVDSGVSNAWSIAAGFSSACSPTITGGIMCWGDNVGGQLGDGNGPMDSTVPVEVIGLP